MRRTRISIAALGIAALVSAVVSGQTNSKSAFHDYRVVTVADGLIQPWSIAFLPGGDALITERPGRLRILRQGKLLPQAVEGIPKVFHSGQGGLLEVMPHPNFASNRLLYVSYSKPGVTDSDSRTALIRGRFENDRLTQVQEIFDAVTSRPADDPWWTLIIGDPGPELTSQPPSSSRSLSGSRDRASRRMAVHAGATGVARAGGSRRCRRVGRACRPARPSAASP